MLAGGCAGAGPTRGLSGAKRTSEAATRAMPDTRSVTGLAPRLGIMVIVSPGWA